MEFSGPRAEALKESYQGLEKKITERSRDLTALYASMAPLVSSDPVQWLQQIVERLKEATGADAALIRIIDKKNHLFLNPVHLGFPPEFLQATQHLDDASAVRASFLSGQPIIAPDIATDPRLIGKRQLDGGFRSCAFLPFKVAGEIRGIIHLASRESGHFVADQANHLLAIARQMGMALENRELFEQTNRLAGEIEARYGELQILHELSQTILTAPDIRSTLTAALEKALSVARLDIGNIRLFDSGGSVEGGVYSGYRVVEENQRHVHGNVAGGGIFSARVIASRKGLVVDDIATVEGMRTFKREGVRTAVIVPIVTEKETLGVIEVGNRAPRKFQPEEVRLLEAIGSQIGIAVQKNRLFQEMRQRAQEQEALSAVAMAASQSLDLQETLGNALDKVLEVTGRERASIRLRHPVSGEVALSAERGFQPDEVEDLIRRTIHPLSEQVFANGKPLVINDGTPLAGSDTLLPHSRTVAWIPITSRQRVIGVMAVSASRPIPFLAREVNFLEAIGNVIGVAIENARHYENERTQVKSLRILVDASQKLVERSDIDTLAQDILNTVVGSFGVRLAWLGSAEPDGLVKPLYWAGDVADYLNHVEIRWDDSPLGQGPAGRAIRTGLPVVMDVATDPGFAPWRTPALAHGYREVAAFPLMRGAKPFGHLILYSSETGYFTAERVELVQTYANIATAALEGARLFEETRRQAEEKAVLNTIATALSQSLEAEAILNVAIDKVIEVTGRERGYIRLKDPVTGEIGLSVHRGISRAYVEKHLQRRGRGGKVDRSPAGEPVMPDDPGAILPREESVDESHAMASIPLQAHGKIIGSLHLSSMRPAPLSAREVELLEAIGNVIGIALENARLYQESRQQQEVQRLLKELSQDITALDIDTLFQKVTDKVREFFRTDIADIRLLEEGGVRRVGSSGIDSERLYQLGGIQGRTKWIVNHRRALVIGDTTEDESIPTGRAIRELGIRGYAGVPLFSRGGEVMGILRALTYEPREFQESEIDLLQQVANGTAIALTNARLFEETERSAHEQSVLNTIAASMSQSLHVDELLNIALKKVLEVTGRSRGSIKLKDHATGRIVLAAHQGLSEQYVETIRAHFSPEEKAAEIFESGEVVILDDPEKRLFDLSTREEGLRSLIWVPLKARGAVVGILNVSTPQSNPFTPREVDLLKSVGSVIGIAVENARLFEEAERRARELAALHTVTAAVGSSFDLEQILLKGLDTVLEVMEMDGGYVHFLGGDPPRLILKAYRGMSESYVSRVGGESRPGGKAHRIITTKQPLVLEDIPPDHAGKFNGENVRSAAWVPILSKEKVAGILTVCSRTRPNFPRAQLPLLLSIGNALGVALENSGLFQETKRSLERIRALREIDQAISSTLDLGNVLDVLLEKIDLSLPYATATIRLLSKQSGKLEPVACRNLDEKEWKVEQWKTGRGIANVVLETKSPLIILNVQTDARVLDIDFYRRHKLTSYVGVPLIVKDEALGVLGFYTREEHQFTAEEVEFLSTLAGQAAIAIHNSQLYEDARLREAQLQESNRMLSALHAVAAAASQSLDLDRVLQAAIEKIRQIFGFDATQIHIYDGHTDELELRASFEAEPSRFATVQSFRRGQGIVGKVAESGVPMIFEDIATDRLYRQLSRSKVSGQFGYRFFSVFPIRGKLKNLGTLACTGVAPRTLSAGEIQLLESLADQIAVALENSELYGELREKVEELERANRVKDEFLSVMSHELRTPLNVVIGYAGLIREGMLGATNPEQDKALDKLVSRTSDLLGMITSILYATSIEANEVRIETSRFALGDLLEEVKRPYASPLAKPIAIDWNYASDLPAIVSDREKIKSILQNLVSNAVKFTEKGRIEVSVRLADTVKHKIQGGRLDGEGPASAVRPPAKRQWVEIRVADTGVGIAEEKLSFIFDKFRQGDSSETRLYGGVGLGLYISKSFTELLGGKIEFETEPGKGSTFIVHIPFVDSAPAKAPTGDRPAADGDGSVDGNHPGGQRSA